MNLSVTSLLESSVVSVNQAISLKVEEQNVLLSVF